MVSEQRDLLKIALMKAWDEGNGHAHPQEFPEEMAATAVGDPEADTLASTTATFASTPHHHLKSAYHISPLSSWYQPMIWLRPYPKRRVRPSGPLTSKSLVDIKKITMKRGAQIRDDDVDCWQAWPPLDIRPRGRTHRFG
ncbi:hypothetical protein Y032_0120g905 [Ancylostoma ceylanicum]|uniref:Uncharacterized protein n=1 Tax=Ancylostoma ceylanicum TaxID=53326 RepID=A0A016TAK5_9BILA|nr:hypothetical protein Y032_0120g905 [Ancylostoma ceylanicum]